MSKFIASDFTAKLAVLASTLNAFSEIDEGGIKGIACVRRESEASFLQIFDLAVNDDEAGVQKATQERAWQHKQKQMNAYACILCSQVEHKSTSVVIVRMRSRWVDAGAKSGV